MSVSKSYYTKFCQCPKLLWLSRYKSEKAEIDPEVEERFKMGNEVGDLAMNYFGPFANVELRKENGSLDIPVMLARTKACLAEGTETICEASFEAYGCFCAVDILHKEGDGYAIYEVKSSTSAKEVYVWDVAFQKWVLEKAGVKVTGTYLLIINNKYVLNDKLDIHGLFKVVDVSLEVAKHTPFIASNVNSAKVVIATKTEPAKQLGSHCCYPYKCAFWKYCKEEVHGKTGKDVIELAGVGETTAPKLYDQGIITLEDYLSAGLKQTAAFKRQLAGSSIFDKERVTEFLNGLKAPLYFFDFETMQLCVPEFQGTRPYMQVPFQYSLHYFEGPSDVTLKTLKHKEFLAEEGTDPRRAIAEQILKDVPENATLIAYNMRFERDVFAYLAECFPEYYDALMLRRDHFADLEDVFRKGYVYEKGMDGSSSIKYVLPALFPGDPEKDYHNLEDVHNGSEAKNIYANLHKQPSEVRARIRKNLLKYCEKDTMAMVWIWQLLVKTCAKP